MSNIIANKTFNTKASNYREPQEGDDIYLNPGIYINDAEGNRKFLRIGFGIAVSSLKKTTVYANMSPEYAAEVKLQNAIIDKLLEKAMNLESGEGIDLDAFSLQMYRRNEGLSEAEVQDESINQKVEDLFNTKVEEVEIESTEATQEVEVKTAS